MLVGIIAASSGTAADTPPGGGGGEGLVLDFENATYSLDGVSKTQSEVLTSNSGYGTWDGTVGADGLTGGQSPVLTTEAKADFLAGFTAVVDVITTASGGSILVEIFTDDFSTDVYLYGNGGVNFSMQGNAGAHTTIATTVSTPKRVAFTVASDHVALSVGGSAVVTGTASFTGGDNIGFYVDTGTIKKATFIPIADDADLPTLSTP
jgi:hypothetical protein